MKSKSEWMRQRIDELRELFLRISGMGTFSNSSLLSMQEVLVTSLDCGFCICQEEVSCHSHRRICLKDGL